MPKKENSRLEMPQRGVASVTRAVRRELKQGSSPTAKPASERLARIQDTEGFDWAPDDHLDIRQTRRGGVEARHRADAFTAGSQALPAARKQSVSALNAGSRLPLIPSGAQQLELDFGALPAQSISEATQSGTTRMKVRAKPCEPRETSGSAKGDLEVFHQSLKAFIRKHTRLNRAERAGWIKRVPSAVSFDNGQYSASAELVAHLAVPENAPHRAELCGNAYAKQGRQPGGKRHVKE